MSVLLKIVGIFTLVYVGLAVGMFIWQRHFIYLPAKVTPQRAFWNLPALREVALTPEPHLTLRAWYHPAQQNKPTLLYFSGNVGNINAGVAAMRPFIQKGIGIFFLSYRGYGQNPGKPSEQALYQDARAAIDFLLQHEKLPSACLILYGESLGTGVAVQMATEYRLAGLILLSPFTSLKKIGQRQYPYLPVKWLLKDSFDSIKKIRQINMPLLVLHGEVDTFVPASEGQALFEQAIAPKSLKIIPGVGHGELSTPPARQEVLHFLEPFINPKCQ